MKETLWKINFICKGFTHDKCKINDSFNCRFKKNCGITFVQVCVNDNTLIRIGTLKSHNF
jgi:hypothetical protein